MAPFGELVTLVFGRGGKLKGVADEIISGLLKGKKSVETPKEKISVFVHDGKTWLKSYTVREPAGGKGTAIFTKETGPLYIATTRYANGDTQKKALVQVATNKYKQACPGYGQLYDKHGIPEFPRGSLHNIEQKLGF